MPELDRLCVWGSFGGLQYGSNEAAPLNIERQEHTMQRVRQFDNYCPVLLQHGNIAYVVNTNESSERRQQQAAEGSRSLKK